VYDRMMVAVPWVLLAAPTVISQLSPDQDAADRVTTLAMVASAGAWVLLWHTRAPAARRQRLTPMAVYLAGLLGFSVALISRDVIFVLFAITGFFHAYYLRPWPFGIAGVFGTSVVINTMTIGVPEPTPAALAGFVMLIIIQTAAIGCGLIFAEKGQEQERRRDEMLARLEAALEENAGLHAQLLTQAREAGVLDERQRMAQEIHDTLAQGLAGIITQVQAAQRIWHQPEQARPYLDRALALARESLAEARRSVQALRPQDLERAQLPDALAELGRRWERQARVPLRMEVTGERVPLSLAIEVTLFRVAQEALTNVARHAGASRVGLTLSYLGPTVLLDVRDDGRGMAGPEAGGFGLNSMRQRTRGVGGTLTVESAPGEGTAVSASVPVIPAAAVAGGTPS
jgi:signal transduction histidine kinase